MSDEVKTEAPAAEAPEKSSGLMSPTDFRIGYDNDNDPDVMIFNVPLKRCADDIEYGSAILRGKLEEAKQIALTLIKAKRDKKKMLTGLARPGGGRIPLGAA